MGWKLRTLLIATSLLLVAVGASIGGVVGYRLGLEHREHQIRLDDSPTGDWNCTYQVRPKLP